MQLYHCAGSRSLRALWTIEEMSLPCELIVLPFPPRAKARAFLHINPLGTVPALIDSGVMLTESSGIAHYLSTRYGPTDLAVRPDEADYGTFIDYLHHADATLTFPQTVYLRFSHMEPDRGLQAAGEAYADWFAKRLLRVEQRLQDNEYLAANRFTVADIAVGYALFLATRIGLSDRLPANAHAYLERLTARDAFTRAVRRES